jgi:polyribonucleotide nucleotidyltransferase
MPSYWFDSETVALEIGGREMTIETGRLAKQAHGAALVTYGETVVLVTATHSNPRPGIDFFPLVVDFVEKTSAAGKIPGGFFKREGRLSDREVLVSRFIDRSIRPLFADGYKDETQIIATVLSADGENSPDVAAFVGASTALTLSEIPFLGPIGAVRVGRVDGRFVINPLVEELAESDMNLIVAGSRSALVMVEGGAHHRRARGPREARGQVQDHAAGARGSRRAGKRCARLGGEPNRRGRGHPRQGRALPRARRDRERGARRVHHRLPQRAR